MTDMPKKVLVVDDEMMNCEILEGRLIPLGYKVTIANSGGEALDKVQQILPDLILMDVMMPGMDGFEVVRRLKAQERTCYIPIVMVTALNSVEDRVKALEVGANDFMSKPIDRAELQATVASQIQVKAYHDHMKQYQVQLEAEVVSRTKKLKEAYEKIKMGYIDTINRLSRAAEFKDEDTGAHILRMSNYSAAIARKLGLKEKVVEGILYAAPMHDVGKIGIPDRILLKPGKLDKDEWEIMKLHTQWGSSILDGKSEGFLKLAEVIAVNHHEKWDGSGYPNGLKGKEIPLIARIVAVADVFDALTSKRPYKEPFSNEKSFAIIKAESGSHFDPKVVDAFLAVKGEVLDVKESYQDEGESPLFQLALAKN